VAVAADEEMVEAVALVDLGLMLLVRFLAVELLQRQVLQQT
jgi:hypothetical protein